MTASVGDIVEVDQRTRGQKLADEVARFGGSWTFIVSFLVVLAAWIILNSEVLAHWGRRFEFDPYPYIFLNLVLSMLAAIQAPIIMMSQNRQAERDRAEAQRDHQVNRQAEMEIQALRAALERRMDELHVALCEVLDRLNAPESECERADAR